MKTVEELDLERRMKRNNEKNASGVRGRWDGGFSILKMQTPAMIKAVGKDGETIGTLDIAPVLRDVLNLGAAEGNFGDGYVYQVYNDGTLRIDNENRSAFWAEVPSSVYV